MVKKNGQREPFDRDKLARSIRISLRKRPVEPERVERVINSIVRQLESSGETDIPSDMIGELVMEVAGRASTRSPMSASPRSIAISARPRISANSSAASAPTSRRLSRVDDRRAHAARRWRWRGAGSGRSGPTPRSAASSSRTARWSAAAGPSRAGGRMARPRRCARAGDARARRHRLCQPRAVLPLGQDAALRRRADRRRHRPRRRRRSRIPIRASPAGASPGCATPASRSRPGSAPRRRRESTPGSCLRIAQGRPLVTLKLATTLDGRIATAHGREPLDHRRAGAGARASAARHATTR